MVWRTGWLKCVTQAVLLSLFPQIICSFFHPLSKALFNHQISQFHGVMEVHKRTLHTSAHRMPQLSNNEPFEHFDLNVSENNDGDDCDEDMDSPSARLAALPTLPDGCVNRSGLMPQLPESDMEVMACEFHDYIYYHVYS
jgi:hypothetical protein